MGDSMDVNEKINKLRLLMNNYKIDFYIIPSADFHNSEYVGNYFKAREFVSSFTGSAGTLIVSQQEVGLWTDGRYFKQAEEQLENSEIKLFKIGLKDTPTVVEYLKDKVSNNSTIGFDGRVVTMKDGLLYEYLFKNRHVTISYTDDLIDKIWIDRPAISKEPAFLLGVKYSGETFSSKLERVREVMKARNASAHIITSLDDIAWLFNIRGNDIAYSPMVLSYAYITLDQVHLFIDQNKLNKDIYEELKKESVFFHDYNDIYKYIENIQEDTVLIDPSKVNYAIYKSIPTKTELIKISNPTSLFKATKNEVEISNIKKAQLKDSVAYTKFMYWLKTNIGKIKMDEISVSEKLTELRKEQDNFISLSFAPISAYRDHAAMMHYSANIATNYDIEPYGMYLNDSGANYFEGSTDFTRTIILGEITHEQRMHFTAVVRGMLNLSNVNFLYGAKGQNLDIIAREPIWQLDLDYRSGTGHGIGYLLSIHEGPASIRWHIDNRDSIPNLEPGMLLSNEPGVYIEGSHGIRIENNIIVQKGKVNEYGQFLFFETVTFIPIDVDGIIVEEMNSKEKEYLNNYHQQVYEKICPYLNSEEKEWLRKYTKKI